MKKKSAVPPAHRPEDRPSHQIVAIYGSPRREGNTATLLKEAVRGAQEAGAEVEEIVLRDLKLSPCLEIYGCRNEGECVIKDDFQRVRDQMLGARGLMVASPIFFYAVSAHTKILMDRFQSLWVKKHWIENRPFFPIEYTRKGLFISVGATTGQKLFDGARLSMKYFFDVLDAQLWKTLFYRGLDDEKAIMEHPGYLQDAREAGRDMVLELEKTGHERLKRR